MKNKSYTKTEYRRLLKRQKRKRVILKCTAILAVMGGLTAGSYKVLHKDYSFAKDNIEQGIRISDEVDPSIFTEKKPTVIMDNKGRVLKKIVTLDTSGNYVKLKDINPYLKKGLVAVEDKRFYQHHGVDPYGTMRAFVVSRGGSGQVQGGSTLTQQLVKNVVLQDRSQTMTRKIREMVIAQNLEKKFSKDQILEYYLNNVSYNHSSLGINQASHYYFGKDQSKLTISQCALLIGMINNPALYDPVSNYQASVNKRNMILAVWLRNHVIDRAQYEQAKNEKLKLKITPAKVNSDVSKNYALSYAMNQAVVDLMHLQGFSEQYWFKTQKERDAYQRRYNSAYQLAREQILKGGYVIHTDINPADQNQIQRIVSQVVGTDISGNNPLQTSITVIDNSTGQVVGIQGGKTPYDNKINRAYLGYHQPGSTAKMLVAYTEAFERGYAPQSTVMDSRIPNGPKDWYTGYRGAMSIRYAIAQSANTPAFKLAAEVKPSTYINKLALMQFDNLSPHDANPIISIGGFTNGVTTTQMASGYSTLARQGQFIAPTNVTSISSNGKTIYRNPQQKIQVFTPAASYESIDAMKSVMHGNGLGKDAMLNNFPYVAGKTGTTDNNVDSYFVGMTPQYTIAVWIGHDKSGLELSQSQLDMPKALFKQIGQYYAKNEKKVDFVKPNNVTKVGDKLYVTKAKNKNSQELLTSDSKDTINDRYKANQKRRAMLSYRIKYHLTLKQELKREEAVQDLIDQVDLTNYTKLSQTPHYQDLINQIRSKNAFVKRKEYSDRFNRKQLQLQYQLTQKQAHMQAQRDLEKQNELEQAKQEAADQIRSKNSGKITALQAEYEKQLQAVKNAYANDDPDKENQKQKLENIIDQLRDFGIDQPDENITVIEK